MKRLNLFLLAVLAVSLFSCKPNQPEDPNAFTEAYDAIEKQMKAEIEEVIAGGEDA